MADPYEFFDLRGATWQISKLGKKKRWKEAISVLEEVERRSLELNVIPCNAVLSALAKCSQWIRAVHALWGMESMAIQPDDFSFGAAITALEKPGLI
eukprot:s1870_g5.t1